MGLEHVQRFADARLSVEAARQIHAEQNHVASVGLRLAPLPEVFAVFFSKREKTDQDDEDDEDDDDEEGEGETLSVLTRILKLEPASTAAKWKTLIASPLTVRLLQHLATLPPSSLPSREALSPFLEFVRESPKASAEAKEAAEALHKKVNAMGWLTIVGGVLGAARIGRRRICKVQWSFLKKGKKGQEDDAIYFQACHLRICSEHPCFVCKKKKKNKEENGGAATPCRHVDRGSGRNDRDWQWACQADCR